MEIKESTNKAILEELQAFAAFKGVPDPEAWSRETLKSFSDEDKLEVQARLEDLENLQAAAKAMGEIASGKVSSKVASILMRDFKKTSEA